MRKSAEQYGRKVVSEWSVECEYVLRVCSDARGVRNAAEEDRLDI